MRGAGSAAFIVGTVLAGQLVGWAGLGIIIWLNAGLLAVAAAFALRVPDRLAGTSSSAPISFGLERVQPDWKVLRRPSARSRFCLSGHFYQPFRTKHAPGESRQADDALGPWRALLGLPVFARLMAIAALVGGSHALHDGFEVIRWRSAGLSASQSSLLWSLSVAAEMVVFLFAGRPLLNWLGPAGAMTLSAAAGVVRWTASANTAAFPIMAAVEPLHGLTFALLHLTCMDVIGRTVPKALAATAQAFYGTIAVGATAAIVTLASGPLYDHVGAAAFWAMAAMCGMALPLARGLRRFNGNCPGR